MSLELKQSLNLKQTLQLVMTPQLQQAIRLLQLNRLELIDAIHQELEQNPVLEEEVRPEQEMLEREAQIAGEPEACHRETGAGPADEGVAGADRRLVAGEEVAHRRAPIHDRRPPAKGNCRKAGYGLPARLRPRWRRSCRPPGGGGVAQVALHRRIDRNRRFVTPPAPRISALAHTRLTEASASFICKPP